MYAGDSQMNGDMPHGGGHGGGGHAAGDELKKTGRYDTVSLSSRFLSPRVSLCRPVKPLVSLSPGFAAVSCLTSKGKRLSSSVTSPTRFTFRPCRPFCSSTLEPSRTPSPSAVCWGTLRKTCRSARGFEPLSS